MIIESSSSHVSKVESPGFGPVPERWLSFHFPLKVILILLRPAEVIVAGQAISRLDWLQFDIVLVRVFHVGIC